MYRKNNPLQSAMEDSGCTLLGWKSVAAALETFFRQATNDDASSTARAEKNSASHQASLRRTLSLGSAGGPFGSFDTHEGFLGDKSVWEYYMENPEQVHQMSRENFYKNNRVPQPAPQEDSLCCATFDDCFGVDDEDEDGNDGSAFKKREFVSRRRNRKSNSNNNQKRQNKKRSGWRAQPPSPPSRESTDVSSSAYRTESKSKAKPSEKSVKKSNNQLPPYVIVYQPRRPVHQDQQLEVTWRRECLDRHTRLVRWAGKLELSMPQPLARCHNSNVSKTSMTTSLASSIQPSLSSAVVDSDVGWITCYSLQKGLTDEACAAAKDPVLNHFCQRFGLWANRLSSFDTNNNDDDGSIHYHNPRKTLNYSRQRVPTFLEQESLFVPYGTAAAQEELQHILATQQAPDGAVLRVDTVLQSMPIFFISDVFIDPEFRGSGLGLVLLDRACRRVADSVCLVVIFLRDYTDERLPHYLGLLGFSFLAPGFLMRRHGIGKERSPPKLDEICPFLPHQLVASSSGRL